MPITQVSNIPAPADIRASFYGPEERDKVSNDKKESRGKYSYAFNETASLMDTVAYNANVSALKTAMLRRNPPASLQGRIQDIKQIKKSLAKESDHKNKSENALIDEAVKRYVDNSKNFEETKKTGTKYDIVIALTREEQELWLDPVALIDKYSAGIREHLHRRVDLYLMQVLNCYGTQLHFEVGKTQHQAESSHSLYVEFEGSVQKVCKKGLKAATHNAAHSSTFPCLVAYDKEEWEQYEQDEQGQINKPKGIYFLQNSDLYKAANSTCNLLRSVNEADIAVDGSTHQSPFSNQALGYINQVSSGEISVKKAMTKFLQTFKNELPGKIRVQKNEAVKAALRVYQNELDEIIEEFEEDPENWIFSKADLIVDHEQISNTLRATMLRLRTDAIKRNMRGQTELMSKVNDLAKTILAEMTTDKKAPSYFREAFQLAIIDAMPTEKDRIRITKVFSLVNPEIISTRKIGLSSAQEKIEDAAMLGRTNRIEELAKILSKDMRSLRNDEVNHRGDSMRALRAAKEWSQEKLGEKVKKRFPDQFSSQSTMSRTERGERTMTKELAKQLSSIFEVPRELLLPQVFFA